MSFRRNILIVLFSLSTGLAYAQESADSILIQPQPVARKDTLRPNIKGVPGIEFSCYNGWGHRFAGQFRDAYIYGGGLIVSCGVLGAGIRVNRYHTNRTYQEDPTYIEQEKIGIWTLGLVASFRFALKNDIGVVKINMGPGKILYHRYYDIKYTTDSYESDNTKKDECYCLIIDGGASFKLVSNLYLDIGASWITGHTGPLEHGIGVSYHIGHNDYYPQDYLKDGVNYDMRQLIVAVGLTWLY